MITNEIDSQLGEIHSRIGVLDSEIQKQILCLRTPPEIVEEYVDLCAAKQTAVNKKRKDLDRQIRDILEMYPALGNERNGVTALVNKRKEMSRLQDDFVNVERYVDSNIQNIIQLLKNAGVVGTNEHGQNELTPKGKIAVHLREVHCLVFATLISEKRFDALTARQLVALFSCFTNVTVSDELKCVVPKSRDPAVDALVNAVTTMYLDCQSKESFNTGVDYSFHFDLLQYVIEWCDCESVEECKLVLQKMGAEKEIFLGEFVKALLKINNISCELEKVAELTGNIPLLSKLKEISGWTLKYVVTNQSLYVHF